MRLLAVVESKKEFIWCLLELPVGDGVEVEIRFKETNFVYKPIEQSTQKLINKIKQTPKKLWDY